jgi:hypothetical protein
MPRYGGLSPKQAILQALVLVVLKAQQDQLTNCQGTISSPGQITGEGGRSELQGEHQRKEFIAENRKKTAV